MSEESQFTINLEHLENYEFKVKFDWDTTPDLLLDEPSPLGEQAGPNASRLVAAAAANCLSASLMFCLSKSDVPHAALKTSVTGKMVRNENKRMRIGGLEVQIRISGDLVESERLKRCLELYEDFCVVTASIREGIQVDVVVVNEAGEILHKSAS